MMGSYPKKLRIPVKGGKISSTKSCLGFSNDKKSGKFSVSHSISTTSAPQEAESEGLIIKSIKEIFEKISIVRPNPAPETSQIDQTNPLL